MTKHGDWVLNQRLQKDFRKLYLRSIVFFVTFPKSPKEHLTKDHLSLRNFHNVVKIHRQKSSIHPSILTDPEIIPSAHQDVLRI